MVCYSVSDLFLRYGPISGDLHSVTGDSDLCPLWTKYTGDSKIDAQDDPEEISTGLCSEDQTVIRFQNHVISCERLLLSFFHIYDCK